MPTLETKRLILRRFRMEDVEALHREIYSDPNVVQYYNGDRVFTLDEVRENLLKRRNTGQMGYWTVTLKETGEVIGQVHLDPYANLGWHPLPEENPPLCQAPEVHLGFAFGRRFWNQGYATEACQRIVRYAFQDLRLLRLLGGASIHNPRSIRLHARLGFQIFTYADSMVTLLTNPLAAYRIRPFKEQDRANANATGSSVVDWWHSEVPEASLHLVAEAAATGEIVGHLQARDKSVPEPTRRPGQCHIMLSVAAAHRRRGIGSALYDGAEAFARQRHAHTLYIEYTETAESPATSFLQQRDFVPLERFLPSFIELDTFEVERFVEAVERVENQGIVITTYDQIEDTPENGHRLYTLEEVARASQPFREVEAYVPTPYSKWEEELSHRDLSTVFLALAPVTGQYVGCVTGLEWYFTGTHPDWRGRGIATALKVLCLQEAKRRGIRCMETENHEDNITMLAINRKLGFQFTAPGVACIKRLNSP